jgi:hypothetical protein
MARPRGGLLALSASGTVGKIETFATWRGQPYVRRRVSPVQPNSLAQQNAAAIFRWLSGVWKRADAFYPIHWDADRSPTPTTDRAWFLKVNLHALRQQTNLDNLVFGPGLGLAPRVKNLVVTPAGTNIKLDWTNPGNPPGYTLQAVICYFLKDVDPHSTALSDISQGVAFPPAATATLFGLTHLTKYQLALVTQYGNPSGGLSWSLDVRATGTTT